MASLPTVGGSSNTWGTELNAYLSVEHTSAGYHSTFASALTFQNHCTFNNAYRLQWKDSGGTARDVLQMYSDDNVYLSCNAGSLIFRTNAGTTQFNIDSTGNLKGKSTGMACLQAVAGSASFPTFSFIDDYDTGMYRNTANEIGFSTAGTSRMLIASDGGISFASIPSGATQVASGAAANELWTTSSHATLPDNVVMIGV